MEDLQGFRCWTVGWGQTEQWTDGTGDYSTTLKSAGLNFMKRDYCLEHSEYDTDDVAEDHFCAAKKPADGETMTAAGGAGCKGDEGGPLICDVFGQATLVGIQDGFDSENCGKKGYPNKYLDLSTISILTRKLLLYIETALAYSGKMSNGDTLEHFEKKPNYKNQFKI